MKGISQILTTLATTLFFLSFFTPVYPTVVHGRESTATIQESHAFTPCLVLRALVEEAHDKSEKTERQTTLLDFVYHFSNLGSSFEMNSTWRGKGADNFSDAFSTLHRVLRI